MPALRALVGATCSSRDRVHKLSPREVLTAEGDSFTRAKLSCSDMACRFRLALIRSVLCRAFVLKKIHDVCFGKNATFRHWLPTCSEQVDAGAT